MSYSNEIYKIAYSKLEIIREEHKSDQEKRKKEIYEKIPEYFDLKKELMSLLGECVNNIFSEHYDVNAIKDKISQNEKKRKDLLLKNSFPSDYLELKYQCEICKDTGYIISKKCDCFKKILRETAISKSNLNYILDDQNFDNFNMDIYSDQKGDKEITPKENMKSILRHVTEFINEFDKIETKSLLFTGNAGVGKTYLSSCISKEIIYNGYNVLYQSAGKLTEILEDYKFNRKDSNYALYSIVEDIFETDLLIIDDLGTEFYNNFTISAIYELINKRLLSNKKMIITTNLNVVDLKNIYTERLFSRFLGEFKILEFIGEDLRTKQIMENIE